MLNLTTLDGVKKRSITAKMKRIVDRVEYIERNLHIPLIRTTKCNLFDLSIRGKFLKMTMRGLLVYLTDYVDSKYADRLVIQIFCQNKMRNVRKDYEEYRELPIFNHAIVQRNIINMTTFDINVTGQMCDWCYLRKALVVITSNDYYADMKVSEFFESITLEEYCKIYGIGEIGSVEIYKLMRFLGLTDK